MTREEFNDVQPGTKMRIADDFVEDPHDDLVEYLGTVQVLERAEFGSTGWAYFEGLPQPFAFSEVECVLYELKEIDDGDYEISDMSMIFGGGS